MYFELRCLRIGCLLLVHVACEDPESFVRGGATFFLFDERREDPNTTDSEPAKRHYNIEFWLGGMMAQH